MKYYDFKYIEKKWQDKWLKNKVFWVEEKSKLPKKFVVDMFPYPSGNSMHVGHPRGYVATDIYCRLKKMQGYNVLHPFGWDAFGLPAEETAIENQEHPSKTVSRNVSIFKNQLLMLGLQYDWSREINTTDTKYYKHTQRLFLEFFKHGLAYNELSTVNWCPELGTVLANEDIVDGVSERGGHAVIQKPMQQWLLAITKYADRLVDDLELLDEWPDKIKNAQRNWIGRSSGHRCRFKTNINLSIEAFTTRLETLAGVTFLSISPECEYTNVIGRHADNLKEIKQYQFDATRKTQLDRVSQRVKTGIIVEGVLVLIQYLDLKFQS